MDDSLEQYLITSRGKTCNNNNNKKKMVAHIWAKWAKIGTKLGFLSFF